MLEHKPPGLGAPDLTSRRMARSPTAHRSPSRASPPVLEVIRTSSLTLETQGLPTSLPPALISSSSSTVEAQESERRRIARDLHDVIGQALTSVKLHLGAAQRTDDPVALGIELQKGIGAVDEALRQVRNFALDLRPPVLDDLGLVAALRWHVDREAQRAGYQARVVADGVGRLDTDLETVCFRLAQEALTNIARHANASVVRIFIRATVEALELTINDNGIGFDVPAAMARTARGEAMGLKAMQDRAALAGGYLQIESARGRGTRVRALFFRNEAGEFASMNNIP
jgi:signal transduction histidine kinase